LRADLAERHFSSSEHEEYLCLASFILFLEQLQRSFGPAMTTSSKQEGVSSPDAPHIGYFPIHKQSQVRIDF